MIKSYGELLEKYEINSDGPGFHGDIHLVNLANLLLNKSLCFIETGTNMGNTLFFVSRNYNIKCYSCEVHNQTPSKVFDHKNILFKNTKSPQFLYDLVSETPNIVDETCFFWLDAHFSGGENILFEEISFITNNFKSFYIFADDVNINNDLFSHNGYHIKLIKDISNDNDIFIPDYNERTSGFHILTGWCLITNQIINEENLKIKKY